MDLETSKKFEEVTAVLAEIKADVKANLAYNEGLDVKNRLSNLEADIKTIDKEKADWEGHNELKRAVGRKASWAGLYGISAFIVSMLGLMFVFLRFIINITEKLVAQ